MEPSLEGRLGPDSAEGALALSMSDQVEAAVLPVVPYRARILVVDDESAIVALLEDYLRIQGFDVAAASSGKEALARLADVQPDVVLLDMRMPEMDGIETLKRIVARRPDVSVLMISGNDDLLLAKEAIALGAFDYILKPIDFGYLTRALEKLAGRDAAECPAGTQVVGGGADLGATSPYDLSLEVCRMARAMSQDARRSVGARVERIALELLRQGQGGDRRTLLRLLNEMRTLLRFAKDLGDITDDVHRHVESCLVRVRRSLGIS